MAKLDNIEPKKVFEYFEQISQIPRGSGNMEKISEFCLDFAKTRNLKAVRDSANNVIIFKNGTKGYENSEPVILQGHLDMVCQKESDCNIDFENDGLDIYVDGDFLKAKGTTLGADNGIAVAIILAVLDSSDIPHPPIEAIFTTDEETGLTGAGKLDAKELKGHRMINIDTEEFDKVTVSCAGGRDVEIKVPVTRYEVSGTKVILTLQGLKGGHSGVEINNCRINANILAGRVLNFARSSCNCNIISINGGDKRNAIPRSCIIEFTVGDKELFVTTMAEYLEGIKTEISDREPGFEYHFETSDDGVFKVFDTIYFERIVYLLMCTPNGVVEMSAVIDGLVETSLNLGVLTTKEDCFILHYSLRSNKENGMAFLEERLRTFATCVDCEIKSYGHYPPWEFRKDSKIKDIYKKVYKDMFGLTPQEVAIHAGLECGVFSSKITDLDCIAIGPDMYDIHTVDERLSVSSTKKLYELLVEMLKNCK